MSERVGMLPNVLSRAFQGLAVPDFRREEDAQHLSVLRGRLCHQRVFARQHDPRYRGESRLADQRRHALPKGSATYHLHVNPNRWTTCKYRAPFSADWEDVTYDWAMDRIAARIKDTRDRTFREFDDDGRRVARTTAIASLGGATLDNEENYLITKLFRSIGTPFVENQARI